MPSQQSEMRTVPPAISTAVSAWMPSSPEQICSVPSSMRTVPAAPIPSAPAFRLTVPPSISTLSPAARPLSPLCTVTVPEARIRPLSTPVRAMPSSPAESVRSASAMRRVSLACRASPSAVTVMLPPAMIRSSFETIPFSQAARTSRLPVPFRARSSRENSVPSTPAARTSSPKPLVSSRLTVPSARVRKTFSACSTRMQASSLQPISAPLSWIHTLDSLFASTTRCPSSRVPETT